MTGRLAILLAGLLALVATALGPAAPARAEEQTAMVVPQPLTADLIIVYKSLRELSLLRNGAVIRTYRIALGTQPVGTKVREGDGRTPEGVYTIDWRKPDSDFHLALHISYPQVTDQVRAATYGLPPGGAIMIHGMPNDRTAADVGHPVRDWTDGCIAVENAEIEEIWALVQDGTQIVIFP